MTPWSKYDPKKICGEKLANLVKELDPITAYTQEDFFDLYAWWHKIPKDVILAAAALECKKIICLVSRMDSPERAYELMIDVQAEHLKDILKEKYEAEREATRGRQIEKDYEIALLEIQRLKAEIYDLRFEAERG